MLINFKQDWPIIVILISMLGLLIFGLDMVDNMTTDFINRVEG